MNCLVARDIPIKGFDDCDDFYYKKYYQSDLQYAKSR